MTRKIMTRADEKYFAEHEAPGLSIAEIAERLGITERKAKNILKRANNDDQKAFPLVVTGRTRHWRPL